jgi:hypothetical protein
MKFFRLLGQCVREEWREFLVALAFILVAAVGVKFVEFRGWLGSAEGIAIDMLLRWRDPLIMTDGRIAVLEIDDQSYRDCFDSTSPIHPATLLSFVELAAKAQPSVIGVDILTKSDRPGYDKQYLDWSKTNFASMTSPIYWAAQGEKPEGPDSGVSFGTWMEGRFFELDLVPAPVLGGANRANSEILSAIPAFPRDDDGVVRRLPRKIKHATAEGKTWAVRIAEFYCYELPDRCSKDRNAYEDEIFLSYRPPEANAPLPILVLRASDYFGCHTNPESGSIDVSLKENTRLPFAGKIVLIGGKYANQDIYDTAQGPLPGVEINAYAIHDELSGTGVREMHHWTAFRLDVAIGILIAYSFLFWKWNLQRKFRETGTRPPSAKYFVKWMFRVNALVFLLLLGTSIYAVRHEFVWISWVGLLVALVIGLLIDIYRENPQVELSHGHSDHGSRPADRS